MEAMLLSLRRRFLFVHVDKTAGMTITRALERHAETRLFERAMRRLGVRELYRVWYPFKIHPRHVSALRLRSELPPRVWRRLFKFAFVRNPWDREVSLYHYILRVPKHPQHRIVAGLSGFDEYLEWRAELGWTPQRRQLADAQGELIVDFVGRFEHLEQDFGCVTQRLGLPARQLPWLNASPRAHYTTFYTPGGRRRVEQGYAEDLELFGYRFGGPPAPSAWEGIGAPTSRCPGASDAGQQEQEDPS